jgi:uncharacterized membrane protein (DUF373 family)
MESKDQPKREIKSRALKHINTILVFVDDMILVLVAIGIIAVAALLMAEGISDFIHFTEHSISHIISDLMFVLIIMELFRQVMRQINRHEFTLNPFLYIGVIASIRGLLLTQMRLGMGEAEWRESIYQLGLHAAIVLVLVASLYLYRRQSKDGQ